MAILLFALLGYLTGSLSPAYLVGRSRGLDLRRSGSGNLGTTNVAEHFGMRRALMVLGADGAKVFVPAVLAMHVAGGWAAAAAAVAGMAGHNWSVYLGFTGGRGVAAFGAGLLALSAPLAALCTAVMLSGYLVRNPALSTVIAACVAAIVPWATDMAPWVGVATASLCALLFGKRALGNGEPLPAGPARWRVLGLRLLVDRDIADDRAWQDRRMAS